MLTNCLGECAHLTITVSQIERDICQKSSFFIPPCIRRPRYWGSRRNSATPFGMEKLEWLPDGEKNSKICLFVLTWSTNVTDTHTHTDTGWRHRPRLCIASRGINVSHWIISPLSRTQVSKQSDYDSTQGSIFAPRSQQNAGICGVAAGVIKAQLHSAIRTAVARLQSSLFSLC